MLQDRVSQVVPLVPGQLPPYMAGLFTINTCVQLENKTAARHVARQCQLSGTVSDRAAATIHGRA
jgi:hypothetical protein